MTIRIQFSTSLEWQSDVIRRMCHSPFSHVDVLDDGGNCFGASNSPKAPVIFGNPEGVALRPADYQPFGIRRVARVDTTTAVEAKFWTALHDQQGKPFDGGALYTFLSPDVSVDRDWREVDSWFCSELVTWALEQAGLWPWHLLVSKNRVAPADLLYLINPFVTNDDTFWLPVPGVKLGPKEH